MAPILLSGLNAPAMAALAGVLAGLYPGQAIPVLSAQEPPDSSWARQNDEPHSDLQQLPAVLLEGTELVASLRRAATQTIIHSLPACSASDERGDLELGWRQTLQLLDALRRACTQPARARFLLISSTDSQQRIDDLPPSVEAAALAGTELLALAYGRQHGLGVSVVRVGPLYGPGFSYPNSLAAALDAILGGRRLPLYGDGSECMDWTQLTDFARAVRVILREGESSASYDITGHGLAAWRDTAAQLCRTVDAAFAAQPALKLRYPKAPPARNLASASLITIVQDRRAMPRIADRSDDHVDVWRALSAQPPKSLAFGLETWVADTLAHAQSATSGVALAAGLND